ncbi:MAG: hypothetical protein KVP17_001614 [Porospora cf. gigantea B]|uniref:uncharacterized protein n=1 Tax=Porospora cf. gigantea B TaxID=2853592 RepID=UPI003571F7D7|nr:MAG: hypothetical protein KVP17_001614 [Porospora cf. gigantea B]
MDSFVLSPLAFTSLAGIGVAAEVVLRLAPTLTFYYKNPAFLGARGLILWALWSFFWWSITSVRAATEAAALWAYELVMLRVPPLSTLDDAPTLISTALVALAITPLLLALVTLGLTTLGWCFTRLTGKFEHIRDAGAQVTPDASTGPVTRKLPVRTEELPHEANPHALAEALTALLHLPASELLRLAQSPGSPTSRTEGWTGEPPSGGTRPLSDSAPDAASTAATPAVVAKHCACAVPPYGDVKAASQLGGAPTTPSGHTVPAEGGPPSPLASEPHGGTRVPGRTPTGSDQGPRTFPQHLDATGVESTDRGHNPSGGAGPRGGQGFPRCTACNAESCPPVYQATGETDATKASVTPELDEARRPTEVSPQGTSAEGPILDYLNDKHGSNYDRDLDRLTRPGAVPEVGPLTAITWIADNPHAYDWSLVEGAFSPYESIPPLDVFLCYDEVWPQAPLAPVDSLSTRPETGFPATSRRDDIPGVFREEDRFQNLRKKRAEFKRQARYLSEDEKHMSLSHLHRKWKEEAQLRANIRKETQPSDFDDLGPLEPEMTTWTKAAIRRVIWSRKQERWLARMRELGVPVHTCDVCSRQVTSQHRCVPTGLAVPGAGDTPYSRKELIVSQQGKNLSLKPKTVINDTKLKEELGRMATILQDREALNEQQDQSMFALTNLIEDLLSLEEFSETDDVTRLIPSGTQPPSAEIPAEKREPAAVSPEQTTSVLPVQREPTTKEPEGTSVPLQYLALRQGTEQFYGLVDTGSQINLIQTSLVTDLEPDRYLKPHAGATEVRGITGRNLAITAWLNLTLELPTGQRVTSSFAVVSDAPAKVVIGLPFLQAGHLGHTPHEGAISSPRGPISLVLTPVGRPIPPGKTGGPRALGTQPNQRASFLLTEPIGRGPLRGELLAAVTQADGQGSSDERAPLGRTTLILGSAVHDRAQNHYQPNRVEPGQHCSQWDGRAPRSAYGRWLDGSDLESGPLPDLPRPFGGFIPLGGFGEFVDLSPREKDHGNPAESHAQPGTPPPTRISDVLSGTRQPPPEENTTAGTPTFPGADIPHLWYLESSDDGTLGQQVNRPTLGMDSKKEDYYVPNLHEAFPQTTWARTIDDPFTTAPAGRTPTPIPDVPTPSSESTPEAEPPALSGAQDPPSLPCTAQSRKEDSCLDSIFSVTAETNASDNTQLALKRLLHEYGGLWRGERRGCAKILSHRIRTTTDRPVVTRPRTFTSEQQRVLAKELQSMLSAGVIEPSDSPHASEIVLVKKKTGDWRVCVDYRNVNDVTVPDRYPLPRIADLIREVRQSRFFVALDLRAGYWQVRMDAASIPYTAFRCTGGLYQFTVMPFGLRNAPATFQRLVDCVVGDLRYEGVLAYLDDILVHGQTEEDTLSRLTEVLRRLKAAGLTLNLAKCDFFPRRLHYLGQVIEDGRLLPDPGRVRQLQAWKVPRTVTELRSLLGLFAYYQDFIPEYAALMAPLHQLLRGSAKEEKIRANLDAPQSASAQASPTLLSIARDFTDYIRAHPEGLFSAPVSDSPDLESFLTELRSASRDLPQWTRQRRVYILEDTLATGKSTLVNQLVPSTDGLSHVVAEEWLDVSSRYGWSLGQVLSLPTIPQQNLILALTIIGLGRARQREPEAAVVISDRSVLSVMIQWGHQDSVQVGRWILEAPPLTLYSLVDTRFFVADFPDEVVRDHVRRRGRRIGDVSEEAFYFDDDGARYKAAKHGLLRYQIWLKATFVHVEGAGYPERRFQTLREQGLVLPDAYCGAVIPQKATAKAKNRPIQWSQECTSAVSTAIHRLSESVLTIPVDGDDYLLETDASGVAVGAILSVKRGDKWLPVAFHSKALTGPMERWPVYEQEAFAIVEGVRKFDAFLRGRAFTVHTDHASLRWMLEATKGKVARWASRLAEYEMTILHKSGTSLSHVDFLSRYLDTDPDPGLEPRMTLVGTVPAEDEEEKERSEILRILGWTDEPSIPEPYLLSDPSGTEEPEQGQPRSPKGRPASEDSTSPPDRKKPQKRKQRTKSPEEEAPSPPGKNPGPLFGRPLRTLMPTMAQVIAAQATDESAVGKAYSRRDGTVFFHGRIYIPPGRWRQEAIAACHSLCPYKHAGVKKTRSTLLRVFNWPGLHQDVCSHLAACPTCARNRVDPTHLQGYQKSHPIEGPFRRVYLDHWSCPYNGKTWNVLTMIDSHTKWAEAHVVADKSAETTMQVFYGEWVCRYGAPRVIVSDRGAAFTSRLFELMASRLGTELLHSTPYHPEGNAPVESLHPRLSTYLRKLTEKDLPFEEALDAALFSYRCTLHGTTGESPYYLCFGIDPSIGLDQDWRHSRNPPGLSERLRLLQETRLEVQGRAQRQRDRALAQRNVGRRTPTVFRPGQLVLLRTTPLARGHPKSTTKWTMPCRVIAVSKNERSATVKSLLSRELREVHIQDITFVEPPLCQIQRDEWRDWLRADPFTQGMDPKALSALEERFIKEVASTTSRDPRKRPSATTSPPAKRPTPTVRSREGS